MRRRGFVLCALAGLLLPVGRAGADDIVLGMSAAFTGGTAALGIECYRGASAYLATVNAAGGVHGRKVVIRPKDDAYDPSLALKRADELMRDPDVLTLFNFVGTPTATRVLPLLQRYKDDDWQLFFPFTGADVLRKPPYETFVFNLRASYRQETQELVDHFLRIGRKKIGVFYQNDVYGRTCWDGVRLALQEKHLKMLAEATYRRGAVRWPDSNLNEQVRILKDAGTDAVISVGSYGTCAVFLRDARDAGWDVPIANVSFVGGENMLRLLRKAQAESGKDYMVNVINSQVVPSYTDESLPGIREYRAAMDNHRHALKPPLAQDPNYEPLPYGFVSLEGYLNAKVMVAILRAAPADLTGRALRKALPAAAYRLKNYSLGLGPDATVSFSPERRQGLDKVYFTVAEGGQFRTLAEVDWKRWQLP